MSAIAIVFGVVGHNHVAVAVKRLDQPIQGIIDRAFLLHHRRIANRADERPLALCIAAHREQNRDVFVSAARFKLLVLGLRKRYRAVRKLVHIVRNLGKGKSEKSRVIDGAVAHVLALPLIILMFEQAHQIGTTQVDRGIDRHVGIVVHAGGVRRARCFGAARCARAASQRASRRARARHKSRTAHRHLVHHVRPSLCYWPHRT